LGEPFIELRVGGFEWDPVVLFLYNPGYHYPFLDIDRFAIGPAVEINCCFIKVFRVTV
jgi:hypothetical protein